MIGRNTQDDFNRRMDMHRQIGRLQEEVSRQKQTICSLRETLDGSVLKEDLAKHDRIFLDRIAVLETEIDDLKSGRAMQRAISAEL